MENPSFESCVVGASRVWSRFALAAILTSALTIGACDKKPGGQVVAVVNGHEITQQELRVEASSTNIPNKAAFDAAAPTILQRIVDRTLLADYARKQDLDRGPEYVARRRQMEETLLAALGLRKLVGTRKDPATSQVEGFIVANPTMFAQRQRFALDQLRFPTPASPQHVQELAKLNSIDLIQQRLKAEGVQAIRGAAQFDTASVDSAIAKQIIALPDGEVFDLSAGGTSLISQIKGRTPAPADRATWSADALEALRRQEVGRVLSDRMGELRKAAKVDYDPAYKPKAP